MGRDRMLYEGILVGLAGAAAGAISLHEALTSGE
jgi:ATP-dependent protease HslVU (ClpYQ) peptidase subunit